jgi:hypothetical protein
MMEVIFFSVNSMSYTNMFICICICEFLLTLIAAGGDPIPAAPVLVLHRVSFSSSSAPLRFVLSVYEIDGTWLGLSNWTHQLQTCGANVKEASVWTR